MSAFEKAIQPIITYILNPIIMLVFAVALFVFVYGVIEMISKAGDEDARSKGRWHIFGGVVGMFIMLSAWGLINLVANTVNSL
jgi:uncharacterized membrane protein